MEDQPPIPERPVKVTYAGRHRKISGKSYTEGSVDESLQGEEQEHENGNGQVDESDVSHDGVSKEAVKSKTGQKLTPKKIDIHLPGPSPMHARCDSAGSSASARKPISRANKTAHSRASSVISNANNESMPPPSSIVKPSSAIGQRLSGAHSPRVGTPDSTLDDVSSLGESSKTSTRIRKTEGEREQFFKDDPLCLEVEPHRALCSTCNSWVDLHEKRRYVMKPWNAHRKECGKSTGLNRTDKKGKVNNDDEDEDDDVSVAPSETNTRSRTTESERQAILVADPRAAEVRPNEVLCKACQKWIKLGTKTRYALAKWNIHEQRCTSAQPSTRVATVQRKLNLVNDPQAKSFTTKNVECASCGITVDLEGDTDYDLTKWEGHKITCTNMSYKSPTKSDTSIKSSISPARVDFPAASQEVSARTETSSTESPSSVTHETSGMSLKRPREEEEVHTRAVRPRSERYIAPEGDSPGFLDWVLLPFRTFVQGFREGLAGN